VRHRYWRQQPPLTAYLLFLALCSVLAWCRHALTRRALYYRWANARQQRTRGGALGTTLPQRERSLYGFAANQHLAAESRLLPATINAPYLFLSIDSALKMTTWWTLRRRALCMAYQAAGARVRREDNGDGERQLRYRNAALRLCGAPTNAFLALRFYSSGMAATLIITAPRRTDGVWWRGVSALSCSAVPRHACFHGYIHPADSRGRKHPLSTKLACASTTYRAAYTACPAHARISAA
jgi:hypothetical protein